MVQKRYRALASRVNIVNRVVNEVIFQVSLLFAVLWIIIKYRICLFVVSSFNSKHTRYILVKKETSPDLCHTQYSRVYNIFRHVRLKFQMLFTMPETEVYNYLSNKTVISTRVDLDGTNNVNRNEKLSY